VTNLSHFGGMAPTLVAKWNGSNVFRDMPPLNGVVVAALERDKLRGPTRSRVPHHFELHPHGSLHPTSRTLHPAPYTLHPTPYNPHPTPYTLHPTHNTLHPTPFTLHPTPYTLHPAPYTLQYTPYALHYTLSLRCLPLSSKYGTYKAVKARFWPRPEPF